MINGFEIASENEGCLGRWIYVYFVDSDNNRTNLKYNRKNGSEVIIDKLNFNKNLLYNELAVIRKELEEDKENINKEVAKILGIGDVPYQKVTQEDFNNILDRNKRCTLNIDIINKLMELAAVLYSTYR